MADEPAALPVPETEVASYIDRVERLEREKRGLMADIREVLKEAAEKGLNPTMIRKCVKMRFQDPEAALREAQELELYLHAAGMLKADVDPRTLPSE